MSCLEVRQARDEDLKTLSNICSLAFPGYDPMTEANFNFYKSLERWFVLVTDIDGLVVGYVIGRANEPISVGYIVELAVHSGFRRCGVATKLLTEAIRKLSEELGSTSVELSVLPNNSSAIALYQSLGFVRKDLVKANLETGQINSWLVMVKDLPQACS